MSDTTANFQFSLRESSDIFNPLSTNENFTKIDELLASRTIAQYTGTVSNSLLTLSGTPTPNDTVFKFVATGAANTWSYNSAVYNIVSPDGTQFTTISGKMYIGYVNENSQLVLLVWPDVVNAQQLDGKPASQYATDEELQAVNTTAGNAVQTAQAAQTVANNALEVAQNAGISVTELLSTPTTLSVVSTPVTIQLNQELSNFKMLIVNISPSQIGIGYNIVLVSNQTLHSSQTYFDNSNVYMVVTAPSSWSGTQLTATTNTSGAIIRNILGIK